MLYDPRWEKLEPWRQLWLIAADITATRGHAKNNALTVDGRVCLIGALSMAATGEAYNFGKEYLATHCSVFERNTPMVKAFIKMTEYLGDHPVGWNNDPDRTGEEVINAMRECAWLGIQKPIAAHAETLAFAS